MSMNKRTTENLSLVISENDIGNMVYIIRLCLILI